MKHFTLLFLFICPIIFAKAQEEKKLKPSTSKQRTVWRLMDGYPKERPEYAACKKEFTLDVNAGSATSKGFVDRIKKEVTQNVKFSPFPKEMLYNAKHDFYIDASSGWHDNGQESNLGVQFDFARTNKAESYYQWNGLLHMEAGESQYSKGLNYVARVSLDMEIDVECLLFTVKVYTQNYHNGGGVDCLSYSFKYERVIVSDNDAVEDCTKIGGKRICSKMFTVEGKKPDGSNYATKITFKKRFYEYCPDGIIKQNISDSDRYAGYDYVKIGEPSLRQNCAGRVSDQLWNIGLYTLSAEDFFNTIISNFGIKISGMSWGKVEEGDVVVYMNDAGVAMHVAIVKTVVKNSLGIIKEIKIDTKDNEQGIFLHTLPSGPSYYTSNDPLLKYGSAAIYRINTNDVKLKPVNNEECN